MGYLVFWEVKENDIIHYATIECSEKYMIILGSNIKSKLHCVIAYDGELKVCDNVVTVVKVKEKNVLYEYLTEEQFNTKYQRDKHECVIYQ